MENRLELNKKPIYELPDEVLVGQYQKAVNTIKGNTEPDFMPDICLKGWGKVWSIEEYKSSNYQIWIKTDDNELINFIMNYEIKLCGVSSPSICVSMVKKIILEEFYNKRV